MMNINQGTIKDMSQNDELTKKKIISEKFKPLDIQEYSYLIVESKDNERVKENDYSSKGIIETNMHIINNFQVTLSPKTYNHLLLQNDPCNHSQPGGK